MSQIRRLFYYVVLQHLRPAELENWPSFNSSQSERQLSADVFVENIFQTSLAIILYHIAVEGEKTDNDIQIIFNNASSFGGHC